MNSDDIELLRRYAFERSEEAFADLVRRHIGLVYSAALRQAQGDAHLAEDIAQVVFTGLARTATRLTRHTSLAGWLYTSTRYTAAALRRSEQRRCARELEAHAMSELLQSAGTDAAWEQLRPVLDEAMHDLKAADREAVLRGSSSACRSPRWERGWASPRTRPGCAWSGHSSDCAPRWSNEG